MKKKACQPTNLKKKINLKIHTSHFLHIKKKENSITFFYTSNKHMCTNVRVIDKSSNK